MKILITGATGMIGSAVCARAISDGHSVVAVIRPGSATRPAGIDRVVPIDIAQATDAADWKTHLDGIDAVVNCAGVLQAGPRQSPAGVHDTGIAALFEACQSLGVRRIVHFSAIGVDRGAVSEFSRTKLAGDEALMAHDLDWVILRPSVVLGRAASGASGLIRGLAALPVLPAMPDTGPLQVVPLDGVVSTVAFFLAPSAPARSHWNWRAPKSSTSTKWSRSIATGSAGAPLAASRCLAPSRPPCIASAISPATSDGARPCERLRSAKSCVAPSATRTIGAS